MGIESFERKIKNNYGKKGKNHLIQQQKGILFGSPEFYF